MKKVVYFFILVLIGVGIWCFFKKNQPSQLTTISAQEGSHIVQSKTNFVTVPSNHVLQESTNAAKVVEATNEPFNAINATNLEQWKTSVKDLVRLGGIQFHQNWIFEQHQTNSRASDKNTGIPIILSQNGKTTTYTATFISLQTKNGSDSDLLASELYSPNMNIDQTRELGLQLCDMLQVDPKGFLAWCNKVGNHWMDMPLYGTASNARLSFKILNTFNNEKPWSIDFVIGSP